MASGQRVYSAYSVRVGGPLTIILFIMAMVLVPIFWPLSGNNP